MATPAVYYFLLDLGADCTCGIYDQKWYELAGRYTMKELVARIYAAHHPDPISVATGEIEATYCGRCADPECSLTFPVHRDVVAVCFATDASGAKLQCCRDTGRQWGLYECDDGEDRA